MPIPVRLAWNAFDRRRQGPPSSNFSVMAPRRIRLCPEPVAAAVRSAARAAVGALPPRRRAVHLPVSMPCSAAARSFYCRSAARPLALKTRRRRDTARRRRRLN